MQVVRIVHSCYGAVCSVPSVAVRQSAVAHQLGRGPRANFTILRPEANAGREEAVPSSIDDGCLLKKQKAS